MNQFDKSFMAAYTQNYRDALEDFFEARRKANIRNVLARLSGKNYSLLSFDEVRKQIKAEMTNQRQVLREIPLDAIVGSVNRYDDFTRDFYPKDAVDPERWARVEVSANSMDGLPPIEVYQLGNVYFVIDGNHRVSVARSLGSKTIQAYVVEIKTRVTLDPEDTPQEIILKSELASFLLDTRLDILRPGSDFKTTVPMAYTRLAEHIAVHQYFMGLDQNRSISREEAIIHWYDTYYFPTIQNILDLGLLRDFPGKTITDLYLWLCDYRAALEKYLQQPVDELDAALHIASQDSPKINSDPSEIFSIKMQPTTSNTPPGTFRRQKEMVGQESCLFGNILVPINGTPASWNALLQAIEIAKYENSNIHGLHVVNDDTLRESEAVTAIQEKFNQICSDANVNGKIVISSGIVSSQLLEHSIINDLIVVNLAFPPGASALGRLTSGFRTMVQRSIRPVLACPETFSKLKHAILAYDVSPTSQEALFLAAYLANKWQIKLTVLTISDRAENSSQASRKAQEYLITHGVKASIIIGNGAIASTILKYATEQNADLIIMGGYGSTSRFNFLFDTVADQILRDSSKPMLLCR